MANFHVQVVSANQRSRISQFLEGFRLILRSPHLLHLCAYLIASASVSAFLYFERQMVVAAAADEASQRMLLFANINSASAFAIGALQITATVCALPHLPQDSSE